MAPPGSSPSSASASSRSSGASTPTCCAPPGTSWASWAYTTHRTTSTFRTPASWASWRRRSAGPPRAPSSPCQAGSPTTSSSATPSSGSACSRTPSRPPWSQQGCSTGSRPAPGSRGGSRRRATSCASSPRPCAGCWRAQGTMLAGGAEGVAVPHQPARWGWRARPRARMPGQVSTRHAVVPHQLKFPLLERSVVCGPGAKTISLGRGSASQAALSWTG
mmetsp:Transcript_83759/g.260271  ORF Transcript_83759/g.260271 Transcript_83759/m.260271 type:complete len:219 (+) Transcript_83759:1534-2190(+)